jgi:hypothetical protein
VKKDAARAVPFEGYGLPSREELVAASSLLAARPDLAKRSAEEIAVGEYCHYSTQTYLFEMIGFQLLGEMSAKLRSFDFVHELAGQAEDEARHAALYRQVVRSLPIHASRASIDLCAAPIYDAFVARGTIEEKVVTAYFVLESVAMGIFAARQRHYPTSPLLALDHRILEEEARHQGMGVRIAAELVRDGRLDLADVGEIVRSASTSVGRLLIPSALFEQFGVEETPDEPARMVSSGILATQRTTSWKAMMNAMRRLHRCLATQDGDPHAHAA